MNLGQHANFIVASYAIAAIVVAILIAWVIGDYLRQRAILRNLDASGVRRRSAPQKSRSA